MVPLPEARITNRAGTRQTLAGGADADQFARLRRVVGVVVGIGRGGTNRPRRASTATASTASTPTHDRDREPDLPRRRADDVRSRPVPALPPPSQAATASATPVSAPLGRRAAELAPEPGAPARRTARATPTAASSGTRHISASTTGLAPCPSGIAPRTGSAGSTPWLVENALTVVSLPTANPGPAR